MRDENDRFVAKARRIVNKFRKSPMKHDVLQGIVKQKNDGKSLNLIRDCKTRWSSLFAMLERFVKLKEPVQDALDMFNLVDLKLTGDDWEVVDRIIACLGPFKTATEVLCKRDCNLAQAEAIIQFIDENLSQQNNPLAEKLLERLRICYNKRKNIQLLSLVKFFDDPDTVGKPSASPYYGTSSKTTINKLSKSMCNRLDLAHKHEDTVLEEVPSTSASAEPLPTDPAPTVTAQQPIKTIQPTMPLAKQLAHRLKAKAIKTGPETLTDTFAKEMGLYAASRQETERIRLIKNAVFIVPPTSVEAERAFSASGLFVTKIRSRLSDKTLDILVFLKFYFMYRSNVGNVV